MPRWKKTAIVFTLNILIITGMFFYSANKTLSKKPDLTSAQTEWLLKNGPDISFAPEKDYPPLVWEQYDELFGVSKDFLDLIQQNIDFHFNTVPGRPLNEILDVAQHKKEKIFLSSVTMTPERSQYLLFTRPYFSSPAIFIAANNHEATPNSIIENDNTVAVGNGFGVHEYLRSNYPKMKLIAVDNDYQVLQSIISKKANIGVLDLASLMYLMKKHDFSSIRKIGDVGFSYNFSFAVPKDMLEFRNILDDGIASIPTSTSNQILKKWGIDADGIERISGQLSAQVITEETSKPLVALFIIGIIILFIIFNYIMHLLLFNKEEQLLASRAKKVVPPQ